MILRRINVKDLTIDALELRALVVAGEMITHFLLTQFVMSSFISRTSFVLTHARTGYFCVASEAMGYLY